MKIVISVGSYKFHLSPLAAEMAKMDQLIGFITAGWPVGWQKSIAKSFPKSKAWQRFLDRYEPIPEKLVCSIPASEFLFKIGDVFLRRISLKWQQNIHKLGFLIYARRASNFIKLTNPDIYHFRDCYGGKSVELAKNLGIITLCDHSIGHPVVLDWMENNAGAWPNQDRFDDIRAKTLPLYKKMEEDLLQADHLLVNSDFVKQTCVYAGMNPKKIHVAYLGIDNSFLNAVAGSALDSSSCDRNSLLFAGGWQRRKGVKTIMDALDANKNRWVLDIAGGVEPEILEVQGMSDFLSRDNVNYFGVIARIELASLMKRHRIFIFPSYCEGSARVIFEAMAAGCYIITTENSGSIVIDGVHGCIIKPGNSKELSDAIDYAFRNPQLIDDIGERNAALVSSKYVQEDYGSRVNAIYKELLHGNST